MILITQTTTNNYESFTTTCSKCGKLALIASRTNALVRKWPVCSFCDEDSPEYNYELVENIKLRVLYHLTQKE